MSVKEEAVLGQSNNYFQSLFISYPAHFTIIMDSFDPNTLQLAALRRRTTETFTLITYLDIQGN